MVSSAISGPPAVRPDGLPTPRRYWAILAIWITLSLSVLDGSIANIALPTIAREMGASASASIWIVNAFQLAIVVTVLPLSAVGDRVGYKKVYMAGLVVFTLSSLACALSQTLPQLTAARVFQGFGAACILSINTALVRFTYPERLLGRGIGYNGLVISIAAALGPSIAAAILHVASWHWLFAINVPIGAVALVMAARSLPRTRGAHVPFDVISALLNAVALGGLVLGVEALTRQGLGAGLAILALALAAAVTLVRRELPRAMPLVPLDLLRIRVFSLSIGASFIAFVGQAAAVVALPFLLQGPLGRSVVHTGLLMTAWPAAIGMMAPIAGRLADRYPAGFLGGIGMVIFASALAVLALIRVQTPDLVIVLALIACGVGFGLFQTPNARALMLATPRQRSGAAGGVLTTGRLLGQTCGALATAILFHFAGDWAAPLALGMAAMISLGAAGVSFSRLALIPAPAAAADKAAVEAP